MRSVLVEPRWRCVILNSLGATSFVVGAVARPVGVQQKEEEPATKEAAPKPEADTKQLPDGDDKPEETGMGALLALHFLLCLTRGSCFCLQLQSTVGSTTAVREVGLTIA